MNSQIQNTGRHLFRDKRRALRLFGFCLFAISFPAPRGFDLTSLCAGFQAFFGALYWAGEFIVEGDTTHVLFGICALAAWLANSTLFSRKEIVAILGILFPLVAYAVFFSELVRFLPFYPWSIGITLVNLSTLWNISAAKRRAQLATPLSDHHFETSHPTA